MKQNNGKSTNNEMQRVNPERVAAAGRVVAAVRNVPGRVRPSLSGSPIRNARRSIMQAKREKCRGVAGRKWHATRKGNCGEQVPDVEAGMKQ